MRHRNSGREQRRENASGRARFVDLLADRQRVGRVAATAADGFGQVCAEQARGARLVVQVARQFAGTLPLAGVRQDLAFGERAHRTAQLVPFGR